MMVLLPFASAEEDGLPCGLTSEMTMEQARKAIENALKIEMEDLSESQTNNGENQSTMLCSFLTDLETPIKMYGLPVFHVSLTDVGLSTWFLAWFSFGSPDGYIDGFYQIYEELSRQFEVSDSKMVIAESDQQFPLPSDTNAAMESDKEIEELLCTWNWGNHGQLLLEYNINGTVNALIKLSLYVFNPLVETP